MRMEVVGAGWCRLPRPSAYELVLFRPNRWLVPSLGPGLVDLVEHRVERVGTLLEVLDHPGPLAARADCRRHQVRSIESAGSVLQRRCQHRRRLREDRVDVAGLSDVDIWRDSGGG